MKWFYNKFYGFVNLMIIELGNVFTDTLDLINQIAIHSVELLQLIIAALTIYKLIKELKNKNKK